MAKERRWSITMVILSRSLPIEVLFTPTLIVEQSTPQSQMEQIFLNFQGRLF